MEHKWFKWCCVSFILHQIWNDGCTLPCRPNPFLSHTRHQSIFSLCILDEECCWPRSDKGIEPEPDHIASESSSLHLDFLMPDLFLCVPDFNCVCNCTAVLLNRIQCHCYRLQPLQQLFGTSLDANVCHDVCYVSGNAVPILLTNCNQFGPLSDVYLEIVGHCVPVHILRHRSTVQLPINLAPDCASVYCLVLCIAVTTKLLGRECTQSTLQLVELA